MDSAESPTLNDQRHEGDAVLASKDPLGAEEARAGEPARDPDIGRNSSDQGIGMHREGPDFLARLPPVQPFALASKDPPGAEEARAGEPARDPDIGRNSSDQVIRMTRTPFPPVESSIDVSPRSFSLCDQSASDRPSIGRRIYRSVARFFITALIAILTGIALSSALQSHGDEAKQMVRTWASSLGLSSAWQFRSDEAKRMIRTWASSLDWMSNKSPPKVDITASQKGSSSAGQVSARDAAHSQSTSVAQKPVPAAAEIPFETLQQLRTMAQDLTVMRHRLEQLAATQEQMTQKVASLQAVGQDIRQKMSSPPASPTGPQPQRKNASRVAPPQPPARLSILADWWISGVHDGYVFVQSYDDVYQVAPGTPLPGLGSVEQIKRQDGRWVVMTPKGIIVSRRDRHYFEGLGALKNE